jgi:hypothetical protein
MQLAKFEYFVLHDDFDSLMKDEFYQFHLKTEKFFCFLSSQIVAFLFLFVSLLIPSSDLFFYLNKMRLMDCKSYKII